MNQASEVQSQAMKAKPSTGMTKLRMVPAVPRFRRSKKTTLMVARFTTAKATRAPKLIMYTACSSVMTRAIKDTAETSVAAKYGVRNRGCSLAKAPGRIPSLPMA
ncbi:hypothetical protein D3C73_1264760 [compost metagenome]